MQTIGWISDLELDLRRYSAGEAEAITVGITGGSGMLGRQFTEVCRRLVPQTRLVLYHGDILREAEFRQWLASHRLDVVVNFAAVVPVKAVEREPEYARAVNALAPANLARYCHHVHPTLRFVHVSTSHVYRSSGVALSEDAECHPESVYGKTKLEGERSLVRYSRLSNEPVTICRLFSVFSEYQPPSFLYGSLLEANNTLSFGETFRLIGARNVRDFLSAAEVSVVMIFLVFSRISGVVNIGSGRGQTVGRFARSVLRPDILIEEVQEQPPTQLVARVSKLRAAILDWRRGF